MSRIACLTFLCLAFVSHAAKAQAVPPEKEARALALASLLSFNESVQAKDFTAFHQQISARWRAQVTPTKLKSIFQTFIDQGLDLSPIKTVEPSFDAPPKLDENNVLVLEGSYPTSPSKVRFRLQYLNENKAWKLAGIDVKVAPGGTAGKLPTEEEAETLVRESLSAFNAAVQTQSFVDFHQQIAVLWQKQVTPEKLKEMFASFIETEADISSVATAEPTFAPAPAINGDGVLQLKGTYEIEPNKLSFDLGYLFEGSEWKLVKINVKVRPIDEEEPAKDDDASEE